MADEMAARLMAAMRGRDVRFQEQEPKVSETTRALQRQGRGDTDYSFVHESNAEGRRQHEAAVRKRAQELREQRVMYPEQAARMELLREAQARSEAASRHATYEAMRENTRREGEEHSTANLQKGIRESAEKRREGRIQKLLDAVVAEVLGEQAKADAARVAELRAVTGAHR
ncbi:hypothetical protein [Streptomyces wuyuanensis]|uniref:hypothetical protein n=1 Tax=Streptomyces wuyuanensis TaxID=1196353 RepID=UPI003442809B